MYRIHAPPVYDAGFDDSSDEDGGSDGADRDEKGADCGEGALAPVDAVAHVGEAEEEVAETSYSAGMGLALAPFLPFGLGPGGREGGGWGSPFQAQRLQLLFGSVNPVLPIFFHFPY